MKTKLNKVVCMSCNQLADKELMSECAECGELMCGLPVNNCKAICSCDIGRATEIYGDDPEVDSATRMSRIVAVQDFKIRHQIVQNTLLALNPRL